MNKNFILICIGCLLICVVLVYLFFLEDINNEKDKQLLKTECISKPNIQK